MKVLITGATGFIGTHLCRHLLALGHEITAVTRTTEPISAEPVPAERVPGSQTIVLPDITAVNPSHLDGIDVVIHLAGVAHDYGVDKSEFERVNVEGTRQLVQCCIAASVRKLVFLSSVKAIAENSDSPLTIDVLPAPQDDYGKSKLAAENLLLEVSNAQSSIGQPGRAFSRLEILIVRIPLVYGEGVKGNVQSLVKLVRSGIPLLFGAIQNKRSYLGIQNLCDFLANCVQQDTSEQCDVGLNGSEQDNFQSGIYHIADEASVSLPTLIESFARAMGRTRKNHWFPKFLIVSAGSILYGRNRAISLFGDLELHTAETFQKAGWRPPYDLQRGLDEMLRPPGHGEESWYGKLSRKAD
jgi:UDP-glucose 4-epimerase